MSVGKFGRMSQLKSVHTTVNSGEADKKDLEGETESDGDEFVSPALVPATVSESTGELCS